MAADAIEHMRSERGERPAVCPVCGYDRRGATGERCTECGTVVGAGVRSRIPWVGRRYTGRVRAYVRTTWMVVRHPGLLAEETRWRVSRRDARRFYWVSVILATLIGTGMFAAAFAFRGEAWDQLMPNFSEIYGGSIPLIAHKWVTPSYALWDRWLILLPVALTLLIGISISATLYRWILGIGEVNALVRRRIRRLGQYHSVLAVWCALLLGPWRISEMILQEGPKWLPGSGLETVLLTAHWLIPIVLAILLFLVTAIFVVRAACETRFLRPRIYLLTLAGLAVVPFGAVQLGREKDPYRNDSFWGEITALATALFGLGALIAAVMAIWCLASRREQPQIVRAWAVVLMYPVAVTTIWPVVAACVFWVCGYLAIGIASMLRG